MRVTPPNLEVGPLALGPLAASPRQGRVGVFWNGQDRISHSPPPLSPSRHFERDRFRVCPPIPKLASPKPSYLCHGSPMLIAYDNIVSTVAHRIFLWMCLARAARNPGPWGLAPIHLAGGSLPAVGIIPQLVPCFVLSSSPAAIWATQRLIQPSEARNARRRGARARRSW